MTRIRCVWLVTSVFLVLLLAAVNARAAEEGGSAAMETATEIFKWINFAIVAGAIIWVFAKALPPKFRSHAESISSAIAKANSVKAEADRQLRDAQSKLQNMQREVEGLRAYADRESAAETGRILALTAAETQKIAEAGQAEIRAAERAARLELKRLAARRAVDGAESLLVKQLTPAAQAALVESFMKSLEGRPN
jgi:F-type H+-transporting ATPase subunit b